MRKITFVDKNTHKKNRKPSDRKIFFSLILAAAVLVSAVTYTVRESGMFANHSSVPAEQESGGQMAAKPLDADENGPETPALPDSETSALPDSETSALPDSETSPLPDTETSALPAVETPVLPDSETAAAPAEDPAPPKEAQNAPAEPQAEPQALTSILRPVAGSDVMTAHSGPNLVYSKTMEDWRVHNGVDLSAKIGSTVCACAKGTVKEAYYDDNMGVTIVIDHGGFESRYQNLASTAMVEVGQAVMRGDAIGVVGDTAQYEIADGAHLHFELLENGVSIDPEPYFAN